MRHDSPNPKTGVLVDFRSVVLDPPVGFREQLVRDRLVVFALIKIVLASKPDELRAFWA